MPTRSRTEEGTVAAVHDDTSERHRERAEALLADVRQPSGEPVKHRRSHEETANVLREAQVHATLALIAALDKLDRRGEGG
jgi:hypothetical protein